MILAILAEEIHKKELLSKAIPGSVTIQWVDTLKMLQLLEADVYIDLLFNPDPERIQQLKKLLPKPVIINSVIDTLSQTNPAFIRINGWPTFLKRDIAEICAETNNLASVKNIFHQLQWNYQLVPDIPGMVSARIVASIINEAYYTFGAGISSKEDIDIAMKLGTNYPYGPFEWGNEIGIERIAELINQLSKTDKRYEVSPALVTQILKKNT
jgi:3-hydroxybutyryl-CoA dehydrogenase